jgi:hypothetical protein
MLQRAKGLYSESDMKARLVSDWAALADSIRVLGSMSEYGDFSTNLR